ncbi:aminoglycoside phosphotransferase family protein [Cohnella sp. LGH]|uniref:phosphotransferase family protein n=1 Tax=Cohnella sp. LGH TaxID=1619153 RepID=UPI001ADBD27B|nr:aminoglycoside phosphotransferase family protein [Cohnella sp. LGH]QTH40675.1 aminoglycoside phosphotransferase family protein [Cohnella sp. LGH]
MANLTKNKQSESTLSQMVQDAFPERKLEYLKELTEGYFNIAYEVSFQDGTKSILKIAPHPSVTLMAHEQNIMDAEVRCMQLVAHKTTVPLPKVEYYDPSCKLCSAPFFFMEKLTGKSLASQRPNVTPQELSDIFFTVGSLTKEINGVENAFFGYPSQKKYQGEVWHDVFSNMLKAVIEDAAKENIDLSVPSQELLENLEKDRALFLDVVTPRLVHWDLWDGNVFVDDGKVTGLIDWERCLWGDPLMEVGFRSYSQSPDFLRGYGVKQLTEREKRRILWYDLYLLMIVAQEHVYRQYATAEFYDWATKLMGEKYAELKKSDL